MMYWIGFINMAFVVCFLIYAYRRLRIAEQLAETKRILHPDKIVGKIELLYPPQCGFVISYMVKGNHKEKVVPVSRATYDAHELGDTWEGH